MKKWVLILAAFGMLIVAGIGYVRPAFHSGRRHAESAVAQSVERIRQLGPLETLRPQKIRSVAVGGARVDILSTNPVTFRVSAMTHWPDMMIYEYDSTKPERGIYHDSF